MISTLCPAGWVGREGKFWNNSKWFRRRRAVGFNRALARSNPTARRRRNHLIFQQFAWRKYRGCPNLIADISNCTSTSKSSKSSHKYMKAWGRVEIITSLCFFSRGKEKQAAAAGGYATDDGAYYDEDPDGYYGYGDGYGHQGNRGGYHRGSHHGHGGYYESRDYYGPYRKGSRDCKFDGDFWRLKLYPIESGQFRSYVHENFEKVESFDPDGQLDSNPTARRGWNFNFFNIFMNIGTELSTFSSMGHSICEYSVCFESPKAIFMSSSRYLPLLRVFDSTGWAKKKHPRLFDVITSSRIGRLLSNFNTIFYD